jgi:hypothetical protein
MSELKFMIERAEKFGTVNLISSLSNRNGVIYSCEIIFSTSEYVTLKSEVGGFRTASDAVKAAINEADRIKIIMEDAGE